MNHHTHEHTHEDAHSLHTEKITDPVCGMSVSASSEHRFELGGETYRFCSGDCLAKFQANPEQYVTPAEPISAPQAKGAEYTCPMHPEVVRAEPGTCPKCGMALEPQAPVGGKVSRDNPELRDMSQRLWFAVALTVPLFILAMGDMLPGRPISQLLSARVRGFIELALATPVCLWSAWPFYVRAARSVRNRSLNMFTLIGLGVSTAYLYSLIAALFPGIFPPSFQENGEVAVYFEASGVIVTLILVGQVLELRARSKTSRALEKLLGMQAKTARRIADDGTEADVPLDAVQAGDRLRVRPGQKVPVDGTVLEGESAIEEGQTVMFVAVDGKAAGILGVADPIKKTTPEALSFLREEGIHVVMLTGDNETTARSVARKLAIDEVIAEVLPDQKADVVARLQREGRIVAMAGDGINDAPALAKAHVGIAMGTGTDVAMESACVTLVKGDLRAVVRSRRLSRQTMTNIKQNLFFAFAYNSVGVPIAAGVLYPFFGLLLSPIIAAAAMSFSSVSVITNALRLRNARI